jgi:hypothetical protein
MMLTIGRRPQDHLVNVAFPDLTWHFVNQLYAIPIAILDVEAVRHAAVNAAVEFHALLETSEVRQSRLAAWIGFRLRLKDRFCEGMRMAAP